MHFHIKEFVLSLFGISDLKSGNGYAFTGKILLLSAAIFTLVASANKREIVQIKAAENAKAILTFKAKQMKLALAASSPSAKQVDKSKWQGIKDVNPPFMADELHQEKMMVQQYKWIGYITLLVLVGWSLLGIREREVQPAYARNRT